MHDTVHFAICLVFVCSFTGGTYHEDNVDDDEEALKSGLTELACREGWSVGWSGERVNATLREDR
jgi:hypothetical protein